MATTSNTKPWMRLWKMWQEADAARGLFEFARQSVDFVIRWSPVAFAVASLVSGVVFATIATTAGYLLYLPAAFMFVVGSLLSVRLLRRQTMPMRVDEREVGDEVSEETESDNHDSGAKEQQPSNQPPVNSPHRYVDRFDVSWRVERVRMSYTAIALRNVFDSPPDKKRARGPYCPSDKTLLKYKDYSGVRALMNADDVGGGGSMHCPTCTETFNPEEGYSGKLTVAMYRKQIEAELNA